MSYLNSYPSPNPDPEESGGRRYPSCLIIVAIITIITLLGTSIAGAAWLLLLNGEAQVTPTAAAATSTRLPSATATDSPKLEETAAELATAGEPAATATLVPPSLSLNRIVYINNDGQVATIDPDGAEKRILTDENELFQFPAWSPDGEKIAVISTSSLGGAVNVIDDNESSDLERLYFGDRRAPFYLYWAPDSETVSFLANEQGGMGLHLVDANGREESRLRTTGGPFYWHWTADSEQILIHSGFAGENARLEIIEAAGEENGSQIANPGFFQAPGISADGRYWAYAEELAGFSSQVIVADQETGSNQSRRHSGQIAFSLNPVTNTLAFITPDSLDSSDFVGPLRLMNGETGETELLSRDTVVAFFWSPDGQKLAAFFASQADDNSINAGLGKETSLSKPVAQINLPTINLIVFDAQSGEGNLLLTFTPALSFLTQFLPFFDQYALSHRLWSPSSDALVLPILEDGRSKIYIVPTNGSAKQFIAPGSMSFWSHQ